MNEQSDTIPTAGDIIVEGKTKKVIATDNPPLVILESKDDITAGDGAKHDVIPEKSRLANKTTCNVFRLLKACDVDVAFAEQRDETSFFAPRCNMLPYEVVVRREAHGSYLKRNPGLTRGHLFPRLLVEFFLKTSGKHWRSHPLVCDDPLMSYDKARGQIELFDPAVPIYGQKPFLILSTEEVFAYNDNRYFCEMEYTARRTFLVLEKAWQLAGGRLVDFKVEFGVGALNELFLADVIDNDSWRVIQDEAYIDKQAYRDGGALDDVAEKYRRVAKVTGQFSIPNQRVIFWRGSESDDIEPFIGAMKRYEYTDETLCPTEDVVCSVHKEPERAVRELQRLVQEVPDCVVIAYVGRSNGAGPTLSAATSVPVITVPASVRDFPEDVWSSLRMPSKVPVMTVLEPSNAVQAALQILSARNPRLYADLRQELEKRLINTVPV